MSAIRIGTSGWTYPSWRKTFYPPGLPARRELEHIASLMNAVEINATFYRLQSPDTFRRWRAGTPDGFRFAIKGSRFITHQKQLGDVEGALANFFASGLLLLGDRMGPFLWQVSERMRFDPAKVERFLDRLPRDTAEAARLAQRHDDRLAGRCWTETDAVRPIRHAFEVRHTSFRDDRFLDLLRARGMALVSSDAPGWGRMDDLTADFAYARLHGAEQLYVSGYSDAALDDWAARIRGWMLDGAGEVHVYFDNDAHVHAPFDALNLARRFERTNFAQIPAS